MTEAIKNILAWLLPSPDAPASERSHLYKKVYIASKASNNNNKANQLIHPIWPDKSTAQSINN